MSDPKKFLTIIQFARELVSDVGKFCEFLKMKDSSFNYEIRKLKGLWTLLVYSHSKNQARLRGEWLTGKTELFKGLSFTVTHLIALETALQERPKTVKGLRLYWKEQRE